jgi:hypothetical protein
MLGHACSLLTVLLLSVVAAGQPLPAGEWLVHMGRDYPLSAQASATDADARITLLFMQAAARVDPAMAEPWYWQADMLAALDRPADERAALTEYLKRRPDDVITCLKWIELAADTMQTSEERAEFYRATLRDAERFPREVSSDLHRRLAEFHWNRGERGQAEEQARAALDAFKMNFAARRVLDDAQGIEQTPARRLEWALAGMVLNPADAGQAKDIGDMLTLWGMAPDAESWYAHAEKLRTLATGQASAASQPAGDEEAATRPAPGTQPAAPEVGEVLRGFPRAVLDYPFNPSKYLSMTWQMSKPELQPGEPWRCTVKLTNVGTFPITFGEERMLVPEVLCSINTRGDRERTSGPTIRLSLQRRLRLSPGESIEDTTTLDVGPIRASMIGTPQVTQQVDVAGVLSPVRLELLDGREAWVPAIGGMAAPALRFRRVAFSATAAHVQAVVGRSQGQRVEDRIAGMELLAMLLAERQHLDAGRLRYGGEHVDAAMLQTAILARVADTDWQVRARLTECMRWFLLDASATQAAMRLLSDEHWLVRGLALRMLADQHRGKFLPVLQRTAESDGDEWVRGMAAALAERLAPTTQPAASQPSESDSATGEHR